MDDQQYFAVSPQAESKPVTFEITFAGQAFRFISDAGVFSKGELDKGTHLLLSALPQGLEGDVLDLGCGWGAVGTITGKLNKAAHVTMIDINERAVKLAAANAANNGVRAKALQSDGLRNVTGRFDHILLNPPIRAGKKTVYRLFDESAAALSPKGALYVVMRKQQGAESGMRYLQTLFAEVTIIARSAGYRVFKCMGEANDTI